MSIITPYIPFFNQIRTSFSVPKVDNIFRYKNDIVKGYGVLVLGSDVNDFIKSLEHDFISSSLNLSLNKIDNEDFINIINALLMLDSLQKIRLNFLFTALGDALVESLQKFCLSKDIRSLNISNSNLTTDGIVKICEIFKGKDIDDITFGFSHYSTDAISSIVQLYKNNQNIKTLNISCSDDINNHIEMLSEILHFNNIKSAILRFCYFGGNNVFYFSEALKSNTSIVNLDLSNNTNINIDILCDGLKYNNTIKFLNLSCCGIVDNDIVLLVDTLKNNYKLLSIDVGFNRFTFEGYKYMLKNLKVQKLLMEDNISMGKEQKISLYELLYNNYHIKILKIDSFTSLATVNSIINRNIYNAKQKSITLVDIAISEQPFSWYLGGRRQKKYKDDMVLLLCKGLKKLNKEIDDMQYIDY